MKTKNQKGITLIALIITIIVMLILVAVSVTVALKSGLFKAAQSAASNTNAEISNEINLSKGQITVGKTTYGSIEEYIESLRGGTGSETEKITFNLKEEKFTVKQGTTWNEFISTLQIETQVIDEPCDYGQNEYGDECSWYQITRWRNDARYLGYGIY